MASSIRNKAKDLQDSGTTTQPRIRKKLYNKNKDPENQTDEVDEAGMCVHNLSLRSTLLLIPLGGRLLLSHILPRTVPTPSCCLSARRQQGETP